ncbi:MAG: DUF2304 domain-containing protein [Planctomycetota bacterium]|nr:DUF2304 domain-containing protein [Planctomycetota bacterium]
MARRALPAACLLLAGCYADDAMPLQQRMVAAAVALLLTLTILELVRKRRLREEYSWLWLLVGVGIAAAAFVPFRYLVLLANSMGSDNPPAAIFFLGFIGVTLLCLQFSVRLSRMTEQIKNLGQKVALLEAELDRSRRPADRPADHPAPADGDGPAP